MNDIAWDGYLFTAPDSAEYYAGLQHDFAKDLVEKSPKQQRFFLDYMAKALNTQGASHYVRGDYEKAKSYYERSLKIRQDIDDQIGVASTRKNIGIIYSEHGDYAAAVKQFNQCLDVYVSLGDKRGIASSYNDLGVAYKSQGLYSISIDYYIRCLKTWDEVGEKKWMAGTLNNIGNLYLAQDDHSNAEAYMRRSLKIRREINDELGVTNSLNSLGGIRIEQADSALEAGNNDLRLAKFASAEDFFINALDKAEEIGSKSEMALAMNGLGAVYEGTMSFDKANSYYTQSLALRQDMGKKSGISSCLKNLSSLYKAEADHAIKEKNFARARALYKKAIAKGEEAKELSHSISNQQVKMSSALLLSDCYNALGLHKKALQNHQLYVKSREELMSEENQRETIRQEYRYAYDQQALTDSLNLLVERQNMAEREEAISAELMSKMKWLRVLIVILLGTVLLILVYRLNEKRKKLAVKAEASALKLQTVESEMKALRSQMNPHFIFNALQSIQTFLIHKKTEDAEAYLLKFSKLMRTVLENSMHEEVPIEQDKKALELYMQLESIRLKHPFTFSIFVDDAVDEESDFIPPLILQPLVENAIWHGIQHKDGPGHISIHIAKHNEDLVCTVEDDGVGRKASGAISAHASISKESLGMKITEDRLRARSELTNGEGHFKVIDLENTTGEAVGTKVELIIPPAA